MTTRTEQISAMEPRLRSWNRLADALRKENPHDRTPKGTTYGQEYLTVLDVIDHLNAQHPTAHETTLTNTCQCYYCESCEMGFVDSPDGTGTCPECEEDGEPDFHCSGCWEVFTWQLDDDLKAWLQRNPSPTGKYRIDGTGMGWRNRTGWKIVDEDEMTAEQLAWAIGPNTEWIQRWSVEPRIGGSLRCSQSHHDAMGEGYTITPLTEDDEEDDQ